MKNQKLKFVPAALVFAGLLSCVMPLRAATAPDIFDNPVVVAQLQTTTFAPDVPGRPVSRSALIQKFDIAKTEAPGDAALNILRLFMPYYLEISNVDNFWAVETLKIGKGQDAFDAPALLQLLNGRWDENFELDLAVSDEEAAARGGSPSNPIVTGYKALRCGNAKKAADQLIPYKTRAAAKRGGHSWRQEHIDQATAMVENVAEICRFSLHLIDMSDARDVSIKLLAIRDAYRSELLIMGFGKNP